MEGNLIQQLVHYYQMNFGYLWELFVNHLLMSVYGVYQVLLSLLRILFKLFRLLLC